MFKKIFFFNNYSRVKPPIYLSYATRISPTPRYLSYMYRTILSPPPRLLFIFIDTNNNNNDDTNSRSYTNQKSTGAPDQLKSHHDFARSIRSATLTRDILIFRYPPLPPLRGRRRAFTEPAGYSAKFTR